MSLNRSIGVLALLATSGYLSGCGGQGGSTAPTQKATTGKEVMQDMGKAMEKMDTSMMPADAAEKMKQMKDMPSASGVPTGPGAGGAPKAPGQ